MTKRIGCQACGGSMSGWRLNVSHIPLCPDCQPTVCVCPLPDPDVIGECRRCRRCYRDQVPGLMDLRTQQMTYLMGRGVAL